MFIPSGCRCSWRCVGCFHCESIYDPGEIVEWVDTREGVGQTALCARCGIDAVIPVRPGIDVTFLREMHWTWFMQIRRGAK